jgi:hypothetical protein
MFALRCGTIGLLVIVLYPYSTTWLCASSQPPSIKMSVCQLQSPQYRATSKAVEVEADVYNGIPHGLFLGDESCPKQRLQLDYEKNAADDTVLNFDKFISHNVGSVGLIAKGRFLGVLIRDRKSRRSYFSIRKVLDLKRMDGNTEPSMISRSQGEAKFPLHLGVPEAL